MRDITPAMLAALTATNVQPAILAEMLFDSATLRLWSGIGTLTWNGNDFLGGGNLLSISEIQESQGLEANGLTATMTGIPSNLIGTVLLENQRGRPFRLYLGAVSVNNNVLTEDEDYVLTEDGSNVLTENTLIDSPYRLFSGLMDTMEIVDTGDSSLVNLNVESILIVGQRNKVRRYTAEDQKKYYPNDRGFDFMPSLQDKEIVW
jgi:hypothetical protein